jgi:putative SOS response-associated peptidase YedK
VPRFAILTVGANTLISTIHDRMPVILDAQHERAWMSDASSDEVALLIAPLDASLMTMHPVSPQVNSSRFESPSAMQPVGEEIYSEG